MVIPRIKGWAGQYYPNTQVAINEYSWVRKGTLMVRRLRRTAGIFGREGLDMACRWEVPAAGTPVYNAFKLYRNYTAPKHTSAKRASRPAPHIRTISRLFRRCAAMAR